MNLIELVPRDLESLKRDAQEILSKFTEIDGVNVPDVLRLDVRSHKAAGELTKCGIHSIPHIRCIDRPVADTVNLVSELVSVGQKSVLMVSGDPPKDDRPTYDSSPMDVVKVLKKEFPTLNVYCGFDPYRQSFKDELAYCQKKQDAGADGFFSQPFFDKDLARIYLEQLDGVPVFVGISPVTTEGSLKYWKDKNHAIFPKRFGLDIETNFNIGREVVAVAKEFNQSTYSMPITMDAKKYLEGIFA